MRTGQDYPLSAFEEIIMPLSFLLQGNVGKNYMHADGNGNQNINISLVEFILQT